LPGANGGMRNLYVKSLYIKNEKLIGFETRQMRLDPVESLKKEPPVEGIAVVVVVVNHHHHLKGK
jgi:hypothetical protein